MERLERDLRYFKLALEAEEDPDRRRLILEQIQQVEQSILNLLQQQRAQIQRENEFMRRALEALEGRPHDAADAAAPK